MIKQLFDLRWKRCSAGSRGRKAVGRNFGEDRQDRLEGKKYLGAGSMRRLTFRRSRLKTKSSHTEQWLPSNDMKVYGLNIRGVTTSGGSNNCTVDKDDPDHFPSFGCSKNVLCSAHSQIT